MTPQREKKAKILVISQYFWPEQFRVNDICNELIKRGYEVTVITGIPNYPEGRFYRGYGAHKRRHEVINGVKVYRLPIISRGRSKVRLVLNYLSFVLSGYFWKVFTKEEANCVFIYDVSPMTQALVGVWYGVKKKIPVIHYVADLWPENLIAAGGVNSKIVLNLIGRMVDYIYSNNDRILTSSNSFVDRIANRGVPKNKIEFLPHYAEDFYTPLDKKENGIVSKWIPYDDESFNLMFTGNIGEAQGLNILPETARILNERMLNVKFNIIGAGRYLQDLVKEVEEEDLMAMFRFIPRMPPSEIPRFLAYADAGLVILANSPIFELYIPAKLQSYMASGLPIIASSDGEVASIVNSSKSGYSAKGGDPECLANAIEKLMNIEAQEYHQMKKKSLDYYKSNFDKENVMNQLDRIIHDIVSDNN